MQLYTDKSAIHGATKTSLSLDLKCRCISLSDAFDFQRDMISDRTFGPFKTGQMCNGKNAKY